MFEKPCGTALAELESCLCEHDKTYFQYVFSAAPPGLLSIACWRRGNLNSCYTSICTSDSLYSGFYGAIVTDCGTAPGGVPAPTTTAAGAGAATTPQGAGPKPTGNSAGSTSLPLGGTGRDCVLLAVMAVFWLGGLGAVLLW